MSNPKAEMYSVYLAGGMFTQHELATNVAIKQAVWGQSNGKYRLVLPQSKELRGLERPDITAYIRNVDLIQVVTADLMVARFDGLELDAGTVVEFMMGRMLGKATVLLRCDSRRLSGQSLDEPYNLMVKSWPRTVEVHVDSLMWYIGRFPEEQMALGESDAFETTMSAELRTVEEGVAEIAQKMIEGLEAVLRLESPYPSEYQEMVYRASRYCVGSGFDELLTEAGLDETIQLLKINGTF